MKYTHFEMETISSEAYYNIQEKFRASYTQDDLKLLSSYYVNPFVRWNNRNVYGNVWFSGSSYFVCNFYRIKRDGTPVRMCVDVGIDKVVADLK